MLAIAVELLTGRYVATAHHHRDEPEWPPHWARLFSALVATWADEDVPDASERAVLTALEVLPPPEIHASEAVPRPVMTHFVPTNDASIIGLSLHERRYARLSQHLQALEEALEQSGGDPQSAKVGRVVAKLDRERDVGSQVQSVGSTPVAAALKVLPEGRGKQPRTYPSVTPDEPTVVYAWPEADLTDDERETLDGLLVRVVRLGHSSSFVACRLLDAVPTEPRYRPDRNGSMVLRHTGPGQLEALEAAHARHQGSRPRSLPHRAARYADMQDRKPERALASISVLSGDLVVFGRTGGRRLPIITAVPVARALRGALMAHAEEPIPEELSGHAPVGAGEHPRPTDRPHVAFLALPFVGRKHATGHLLGVAALLPRDIAPAARVAVLRAIGRWERAAGDEGLRLALGAEGVMAVSRVVDEPPQQGLQRRRWSKATRTWGTVTPIALDRHPGDLRGRNPERVSRAYEDAAATIAAACRNVGLPEPQEVHVTVQPPIVGTRPAQAFPRFRQGQGDRAVERALVHARLTFPVPVEGPLLLGAGRYFGLGLLAGLDDAEAQAGGDPNVERG